MDTKTSIGLAVSACTLVGGLFAFDARYMKATAGEVLEQHVAQLSDAEARAREAGDLQTQLTLHRNRLSYLSNKEYPTADEREEMDYLRVQIRVISERLANLRASG